MLADPRAREATSRFLQPVLQVRKRLAAHAGRHRKFPWFDDNLRKAFVRETELFLDSQLEADRSVVDLLTPITVPERAARASLRDSNVYGSHSAGDLADQNRWGLLGKASILAITSYPHRTSPTIRGKWLLENILAAPVPPPPPSVNTNLEEATKSVKTNSVREMLEQHRANPGCASCHARMDPLGFSLENFDGSRVGRGRVGDQRVGLLMDGNKVDGPAALGRRADKKGRREGSDGQAPLYAVGRQWNSRAPAIREIRRRLCRQYSWSSTILAREQERAFQSEIEIRIVTKRPFPAGFAGSAYACLPRWIDGAGLHGITEDRQTCPPHWRRLPSERGRLRERLTKGTDGFEFSRVLDRSRIPRSPSW